MNKLSKKSHPLYNLIYNATDNFLTAEDEESNNKICSEILRSTESSKLASKLIIKIINKSLAAHRFQSIWYCLLLLDYSVKSTDARFCASILTKEFLGDLIKIMDPKYFVPEFVQEKLLYIMKEWVSSLTNVSGYQNLVKYYNMVQYPQAKNPKPNQCLFPAEAINFVAPPTPIIPIQNLSFKDKIIRDIDIIETNLTIFSDCIRSLNPETITTEEMKFLEELYETGIRMQERINELLPSISWEDIIYQLIQVNDKILFTAEKYKRLLKAKAQLTLSRSHSIPAKSTMDDVYDTPVMASKSPNKELPEIYAIGSLPSYSEAVSFQNQNKNTNKELNLISFDDEDSLCKSYRNMPLPSIPNDANSNLPAQESSGKDNNTYKTQLSSNEFDEFIELIARRQNQSTEPLEEIYAPPVYEEANSKPNKP